jgi:glutamyl-tRNA synthetase
MEKTVKVRIAPSPTGEPHVGTAYIALFNSSFAKSCGGKFILRIEDTDQARSTKESEQSIMESLRWLGLTWDEGPDVGGPSAPYRQSERLDIYARHVEDLLDKEQAYYCFCSSQELETMRQEQIAQKLPQRYDGRCRAISRTEAEARKAKGESYVIRLKVPRHNEEEEISFYDLIRKANVSRRYFDIDDQVLMKSDGFPTYHLANVVDDHLMGVTHVIRGEEWIPSTPKHILLYRAFGWEPPNFAHLSLLRNSDKTKVSKRRNPVSLTWFQAAGYIPSAMLNFLGLLGYTYQDGVEDFTLDDLARTFSFDKFSTTAPVFNYDKLDDINHAKIRALSPEKFLAFMQERQKFACSYLAPVLEHIQKRYKIGERFDSWTEFFFKVSLDYDRNVIIPKGQTKEQVVKQLAATAKALKDAEIQSPTEIEALLKRVVEKEGLQYNQTLMAVRIAITGSPNSLPLFEAMSRLGKDRCAIRIKEAENYVKSLK